MVTLCHWNNTRERLEDYSVIAGSVTGVIGVYCVSGVIGVNIPPTGIAGGERGQSMWLH